MNNTGLSGGLYMISEWIMRFSVINILWVVFNLPIVFILLNILFIDNIGGIIILMIPIILLLPVLFFPATIAMFATVRDWIIKENTEDKLFKSYWKYYKENYKRAVLNGILLTAIWGIWAADLYYFSDKNIIITYLFAVLGILLLVFTINLFSVTVHYNIKFISTLRNAFYVTIGSPLLFMTVAISSGIILYISIHNVQFLWILCTGTLIAFLSFSAFYSYYLKVSSQE